MHSLGVKEEVSVCKMCERTTEGYGTAHGYIFDIEFAVS